MFGFGDGSNDAVVLCATHGAFLFVIFTFIVSHKYRVNQTEAFAKSNFVYNAVRRIGGGHGKFEILAHKILERTVLDYG